jgi:peptidoglycan-associated lipoprotein
MSMRKIVSFVAMSLLALSVATSASADHHEDYSGWNVGLGGGAILFEGDEELSHTHMYGITVGYDFNSRWTLEGNAAYLPSIGANTRDYIPAYPESGFRLDGSTWGLRFGSDLLYHLVSNPASSFDPFVGLTAGMAFYRNRLRADNRWDPYAGVAAGMTYWLTKGLGIRGDYKLVVAGHDTEFNNLFMLSLTYSWGRRAKAVAGDVESDNLSMGDMNPELKPIYFAFDSSSLSAQAKQVLKENADYLSANPGTKVVLEGHCDERGTEEYNLALGERRARSAFEYLRSLGVSSERMSSVSYGESRPADPGRNEAAYAKNRRVECVELPR